MKGGPLTSGFSVTSLALLRRGQSASQEEWPLVSQPLHFITSQTAATSKNKCEHKQNITSKNYAKVLII